MQPPVDIQVFPYFYVFFDPRETTPAGMPFQRIPTNVRRRTLGHSPGQASIDFVLRVMVGAGHDFLGRGVRCEKLIAGLLSQRGDPQPGVLQASDAFAPKEVAIGMHFEDVVLVIHGPNLSGCRTTQDSGYDSIGRISVQERTREIAGSEGGRGLSSGCKFDRFDFNRLRPGIVNSGNPDLLARKGNRLFLII